MSGRLREEGGKERGRGREGLTGIVVGLGDVLRGGGEVDGCGGYWWCCNFSVLWAEGRLVWWGHVMQGYLLAFLEGGIGDGLRVA